MLKLDRNGSIRKSFYKGYTDKPKLRFTMPHFSPEKIQKDFA